MGMGFAPTWLRQVSPPPLHKTTLTTAVIVEVRSTLTRGRGKEARNGKKVVESRMLHSASLRI